MRKRRISERDAQAILSGHAPASRPDLVPLADSIAEFRAAAFESPVQPSAELTARLGLLGGSPISSRTESQPGTGESRKRVTVFSWIAGLGLVAKIALGAGVAVAATAGAGAAGVLPNSVQVAFDQVVSTVVPTSTDGTSTDSGSEDVAPEPAPTTTSHPDNFGSWVSDRAQDPNKVGQTFGQETSEAARNKHAADGSKDGSADESTEGSTDGSTESGSGKVKGPGVGDDTGTGDSSGGQGKSEGAGGKR